MRMNTEMDLIGVFTVDIIDALNVATKAGSSSSVVGPENHADNPASRKGRYYTHFHANCQSRTHAFFNEVKIKG